MAIEIRVPALGESVTEATVGQWFKKPGDAVKADEPLLELETDKVTLEVPAPVTGVLADIVVPQGSTVAVGAVLGRVREGDGAATKAPAGGATNLASEPAAQQGVTPTRLIATPPAQSSERSGPVAPPATALKSAMPPSPSARKLMEESKVSAEDVAGSGRVCRTGGSDGACDPALGYGGAGAGTTGARSLRSQ